MKTSNSKSTQGHPLVNAAGQKRKMPDDPKRFENGGHLNQIDLEAIAQGEAIRRAFRPARRRSDAVQDAPGRTR